MTNIALKWVTAGLVAPIKAHFQNILDTTHSFDEEVSQVLQAWPCWPGLGLATKTDTAINTHSQGPDQRFLT